MLGHVTADSQNTADKAHIDMLICATLEQQPRNANLCRVFRAYTTIKQSFADYGNVCIFFLGLVKANV